MAASGTYALAPDNADFIEEAFERCGMDPATLIARHLKSAIMSIDLLFSYWTGMGVRPFLVDEQTQTLTDGTAAYTAATGTIYLLEGIIRRSGIDTPVYRMTRDQYHLIPDKTTEGLPSQAWFNRATAQYTLWQVPENSTDVFRYRRMRRHQDAGNAQATPDLPYHWFEALASGLAEFLSLKFAPNRFDTLQKLAAQRLTWAVHEDRERGDTTVEVSI